MTSYKEPLKITITMSPKELRDLADKSELVAAVRRLGQTTFVDFLAYEKDYVVCLNFDQEKTPGSSNYKP
jgi:hypothetical protein